MSGNMTSNEYNIFYHFNTEILAKYAGALAVILPLVTLLTRLVLRPRVVVNCWFCNTNSRVASAEANSWCCLHCEQYNGFLPDGDYNKDIPEQRFGGARTKFTSLSKPKVSLDSNGLCDKCNDNQEMKVMHLAAFQAAVPSNYEEELNIYRNQLENAYRLCQKCETVVSEVLERKKGLVLGIQLQQSEKRTMERSKFFKYSQLGIYRVILTAVATTLCMVTVTTTPFLKNMDFPMLNLIQEQVETNFYVFLAVNISVLLVLTLYTARKLPLVVCGAHLCLYLWNDYRGSLEDYSYALSFLSGLTLILTLCSNKTRKSAFVKIQKINKSSRNSKLFERERTSVSPEVKPSLVRPSVKEEERAVPARLERDTQRDTQQELSSVKPQDDTSSVDSAFSNHDSVTQDSDSVRGDVNSLIQSLSDWNSGVQERPRTPSSRHEFQSRQYKPVLNPARLVSTSPKSTSPRSVNESSWVAGGFWQNLQNESEHISRPGSPNCSVHSEAASSWHSSTPGPFMANQPLSPAPAPATQYPMYVPYGPPNGFQQPFGFQPYMYPTASVVNPMWNPAPLFQTFPSSHRTPSSASCSSASTCGSVRRRYSDSHDHLSDTPCPNSRNKHPSFWEVLRHNSSIILYTSVFYIAVTAATVFAYHKL